MHTLREEGGQKLAREMGWKEVPGRGLEEALVTWEVIGLFYRDGKALRGS